MSFRTCAHGDRVAPFGASMSSRAATLAATVVVGLLSVFTGVATAQQDIFAVPKDAKTLNWDWYARKESRELTFNRFSGLSPDYRIGAGDELQVQVVGFEGPFNFRVKASGDIGIPLVGDIKVANLTSEEAEEAIAARFRDKNLIRDPEVLIFIYSYEAKKFWVYGQIDRPGEYVMSQQLTVMDAILMAGGLDYYGSDEGYLHRRNPGAAPIAMPQRLVDSPDAPQPGHTVIRLDLRAVRNGQLLSPNPPLQEGDVIVIPTRYPTIFYVLGDVAAPGPFLVNNGIVVTVSQALSQAGGPTRTAKASKGVLVRYSEDGARHELPVDYFAILEGRQKDFEILSNDVIYIPGSGAKSFGLGLLGGLPQVVAEKGKGQ